MCKWSLQKVSLTFIWILSRISDSGNTLLKVINIIGTNYYEEEYEDTKRATRIHTSKKNRQHNGQNKKHKRTNNDQQNTHIKLKIK